MLQEHKQPYFLIPVCTAPTLAADYPFTVTNLRLHLGLFKHALAVCTGPMLPSSHTSFNDAAWPNAASATKGLLLMQYLSSMQFPVVMHSPLTQVASRTGDLDVPKMRQLLVTGLNAAIQPKVHFAPKLATESNSEYRARMTDALFCCLR